MKSENELPVSLPIGRRNSTVPSIPCLRAPSPPLPQPQPLNPLSGPTAPVGRAARTFLQDFAACSERPDRLGPSFSPSAQPPWRGPTPFFSVGVPRGCPCRSLPPHPPPLPAFRSPREDTRAARHRRGAAQPWALPPRALPPWAPRPRQARKGERNYDGTGRGGPLLLVWGRPAGRRALHNF